MDTLWTHLKIVITDLTELAFGVTVAPAYETFDWIVWIINWLCGGED